MLFQATRCSRAILQSLKLPAHRITTRMLTTPPNRGRGPETVPVDKSNPEPLFQYSAQRWLWNEPEQLRRRYVQFDLNALIQIAEEAAGHDTVCLKVSRLPEGNFNKAFLATMDDGRQLVVKIPNPNAGPAHYTTASEVATMQFVRDSSVIKPLANYTNLC